MSTNARKPTNASFFLYKDGITVPRDVTHIIVDPSVTFLPARAFSGLLRLRDVVLPEGLQEIGAQVFDGCISLEQINFPSTLIAIGSYLCSRCTSLREVVLPEGLPQIPMLAFHGCTSLKRINFPSTLTLIGPHAFSCCTLLREVVLPEGLQEIRDDAFLNCTSLERINFPSTLTAIGRLVFRSCTSLREVVLPEGLREIGDAAFRGCTSLKQINFPSTLTVISCRAFFKCVALKEVELCEGLQSIRSCGFGDCCSLLHINIPSSVTEIGEHAFGNCNLLRNVAVFSTSFRHKMFDEFTSLHAVNCSLDTLEARFDELPIHRMCYDYPHQSMGITTLGQLSAEVNKHEQTKMISQDCLGMTPLHILASSGKHDIELYKYLVEKCPDALITGDKWGETPLRYALLSEAPLDVVIFLLGKHCTKWGQLPFDFGEAIKSLAEKNGTSGEYVQIMIRAQRTSFPNLNVEWGRIVDETVGLGSMPNQMFQLLVEASVSKRANCMNAERQIVIRNMINGMSLGAARAREEREQLRRLITDYAQLYYQELKEATTLIELVLWKAKVDELNHATINTDWNFRKMGLDNERTMIVSLTREECRVKCRAEEVVPLILSYL